MGEIPGLTNGAIQDILSGAQVSRPLIQVLNMKKIQSEGGNQERYRLQVSDGLHYQPCMLATQMNEKVQSGELAKWSVMEVERFVVNTIHQKKIIILIGVRIVKKGSEVNRAIGQPKQLELVCVPNGSQSNDSRGHRNGPPGPGGRGGDGGGAGSGGNFQGGGNQGGGGFRGGNTHGNPQQQQGYRSGGGSYGNTSGGTNRSNGPPNMGGGAYRSAAAPPSRPGFGGGMSPGGRGPQFPGSAPLSQATLYPISSLNPYQNKWTIRVRVASKPSIREWSNSRGQGKVFNVDLVDESGEIRACAFNQMAEKLNSTFEMGKVYYISRGRLRPANKQFNTTKNDYELTLNEDSEVELCTDSVSDSQLPTVQYNFRPIADLESIEPNQLVDVIGICKTADELSSVITKASNRKLSKRDLHLVDRSGCEVRCTLWGAEAEGFDGNNSPVVAVKGARVSDFGGRSLSTLMSSLLVVEPDIPEAHQLRGWFDNVGKNEQSTSLSDQRGGGGGGASQASFLTLGQVKELDLGHGDKPDYFSSKASISFIKSDNCLYKACPNPDCNKKVTEGNAGDYFCEKCNQGFPNFKYRIILSVNTSDFASNQWITCFQDTGAEILGCSAQDLGEMREQNSPEYDSVFQKANFKDFIFRVRAKMDTYNDEQRLKCYCVGVQPVNYAQEARRRIEDIKQMMSN